MPEPNPLHGREKPSLWRHQPLVRKTLLPSQAFKLDSIQGHLEMAEWYHERGVKFSCDPADSSLFNSMYQTLCQLQQEGYLLLEWQERTDGHLVELKQIALTTSGQKLLSELQNKSPAGKLKEKLVTIAWAAATSVVTTLAVMAFKS